MYIYNISWGHSVLSYLQMLAFFFFPLLELSFPFEESVSQSYVAYVVLSLVYRVLKYTDIFYFWLNEETFMIFQMGITVCENWKQFPEQKTKQS